MTFLQVMQNLQSKAHENITIMFKQLSHDELFGIKRAQEAAKAEIAMQYQAGGTAAPNGGLPRVNSPMRGSTLMKAQQGDMLTQLIAKADVPAAPAQTQGTTQGAAAPPAQAGGGGKGGKGGKGEGADTYWW
jgi:hypothetical protein